MKIDFQETTKDLAVRIDIHSKFGAKNIDTWMLDLINLQPNDVILDVGCGSGKQCFSYYDRLNGKTARNEIEGVAFQWKLLIEIEVDEFHSRIAAFILSACLIQQII